MCYEKVNALFLARSPLSNKFAKKNCCIMYMNVYFVLFILHCTGKCLLMHNLGFENANSGCLQFVLGQTWVKKCIS